MPPTNLFGLGFGVGPAGYGYPSAGSVAPPTLSYASPQSWTYGTAITPVSPTTTGATSFAEVGSNLSSIGISVNPTTGAISGVPTDGIASTVATIRATGPGGTADATMTFSSVRTGALFVSANAEYLSKTSPTFSPTTAMTIRLLWKPTTTALFCLVSRREAGQAQFVVYVLGTGLLRVRICLDGDDTVDTRFDATATTFSAGSSYEIVIVYDGGLAAANRLKVYIDGVLEAGTITGTMPTSLIASTSALQIGSDANGTYCNGAIQALGISALALSGDALTAAHLHTPYDAMSVARKADWFSFYDLKEASGARADATGLNDLTDNNTVGSVQLAP